jgi:hypothetical protein
MMHEKCDENDQRDRNPDQPEKKSASEAHVFRLLLMRRQRDARRVVPVEELNYFSAIDGTKLSRARATRGAIALSAAVIGRLLSRAIQSSIGAIVSRTRCGIVHAPPPNLNRRKHCHWMTPDQPRIASRARRAASGARMKI